MDQGLGLKNTHPVDDASSSDVRIAKDNSGPVFEFKETEMAFILTTHLEGYRKEHVKVDPSEDETRIIIFLEKPLTKKKKVFRIPDGVKSSKIRVKFDELESTLIIDMPKVKKGVVGVRVEEVKEEEADKKDGEEVKQEGADIGTPQIAHAASDEVPEKDGVKVKEGADIGTPQKPVHTEVENFHTEGKKVDEEEDRSEIPKSQAENSSGIQESEESKTAKIEQADEIEKKREDAKETIEEEKHGQVKKDKSTEASPQVAELSQETVVEEPRIEKQNTPEKKEVDECKESEESKTANIKLADGIEKKREDAKETIKEEKHGQVKKDKGTEASPQVAEPSQETVVKEPSIEKQNTPEKKEVDECKSSEMGNGKDVGGKSTPETKPAATEMTNPLRTPLIIVGSALLVSIVLLAINRIRNRKKR